MNMIVIEQLLQDNQNRVISFIDSDETNLPRLKRLPPITILEQQIAIAEEKFCSDIH